MPSSAASQAPRSDVSSQGYATTVVAGGTLFASEMSFSYLLWAGWPKGPPGCNGTDLAVAHLSAICGVREGRLFRHEAFAGTSLRTCGTGIVVACAWSTPKSRPISRNLFSSSADSFPQQRLALL